MSIQELEIPRDVQRYGVGLQKVHRREESFLYLMCKRGIDISCSLTALLVLIPFLLLMGILIKLEDPAGSVLFSQVRIGKNGKSFKMYKLRSMVTNAEDMLQSLLEKNDVSGDMFKMKDDPRVTRIGRIIRKTSIDELPQLWNVLKGDMSLVGPRPPLPREVKGYSMYAMQRLLVTPGCTGLWQVSGRNSVGFERMLELDLKYIAERSLFIDIVIMLKTFRVLLGSRNAY
jgi:lipopolysaccharide/colanic/teichoic acid biosynthesis glycosyltransferase